MEEFRRAVAGVVEPQAVKTLDDDMKGREVFAAFFIAGLFFNVRGIVRALQFAERLPPVIQPRFAGLHRRVAIQAHLPACVLVMHDKAHAGRELELRVLARSCIGMEDKIALRCGDGAYHDNACVRLATGCDTRKHRRTPCTAAR